MSFPPNSPGNQPVLQTSVASSLWCNKLKIVGSGQNWSVAPPFYLLGAEPPAPDANLTGAKDLIEHYGLQTAFQKFCGRKLRDELSAFLPHLSGNVNMPASEDGSGLLTLIERPPITGKELLPFAPSQLDHGFRLHPGPLPQEYMALFMAPPSSSSTGVEPEVTRASSASVKVPVPPGVSSQPLQVPRGPNTPAGSFARKRRRDVHRGSIPPYSVDTPASVGAPVTSAVPMRTQITAPNAAVAVPLPHSGPAPMPSLQLSNNLLPPPLLSSIPQPQAGMKPQQLSQPPYSLPHHNSLPSTISGVVGPPSLKTARRLDEYSVEPPIFNSGAGSSSLDHILLDEERRKKKKKEKRYKKERD